MKILAKINYRVGQLFNGQMPLYTSLGLKGHNGIDYPMPTGTLLECVIKGKVEYVGEDDKSGKGVYIISDLGQNGAFRTIYWHMLEPKVKVGDLVEVGDIIGISDNTGMSTGPHLHFGLKPVKLVNGFWQDTEHNNGYNGAIDPFPLFSEVIYPPIKKGMTGQFVEQIQTYLNQIENAELVVDGKFGNKTFREVCVFQTKNGLKVDGICGTNTMNKILTFL